MTLACGLSSGLAALGLPLPEGAADRLSAYLALLQKWNRVYNLTAIRDEADMVTHHLLDSLAVVPYVAPLSTLADVGSGAGLPGLVMAMALPHLQVISIEAVQKKAAFQQQVKIELGLDNVTVVAGRVESFSSVRPVDAVISRAFADLADFVSLTAHLASAKTRILAMKGVYPADEIARIPAGFAFERSIELTVPGLDAERHLIIVKRT